MFLLQETKKKTDNDEKAIVPGSEDELPCNGPDDSSIRSASTTETASMESTVVDGPNEGGPPIVKKRKAEKVSSVEKRMDEAYNFLKQVATKPKDESSLFCELLCSKLRALDNETREIAMHEINNLMFNLKRSRKNRTTLLLIIIQIN